MACNTFVCEIFVFVLPGFGFPKMFWWLLKSTFYWSSIVYVTFGITTVGIHLVAFLVCTCVQKLRLENNNGAKLSWLARLFYTIAFHLGVNFIHLYSILLHSYTVEGMENIPKDRPVIFAFYHGVISMDAVFFVNQLYKQGAICCAVMDHFVFKWPVAWGCMEILFPGPRAKCVAKLKAGMPLALSPGGAREGQFGSSQNYEVMWNRRAGYARAAKEAQVSIVPVFTTNIREVFWVARFFPKWARDFYERTRIPPYLFMAGPFPVKLTTRVGQPIPFDAVDSAEELAELTKSKIEEMIAKHQRLPGSYVEGIKERFTL